MRTREVRRDRVVVGFDGSDAAVRALARAADEIEPGGTLTIVSVQADVRSSGALSEDLLDSTTAAVDIVEEARLSLGVRDDITVETVPGTGEPATVILDVARKSRADLIVVGRRGRDFAARVLLGSVAARVVEQAPATSSSLPDAGIRSSRARLRYTTTFQSVIGRWSPACPAAAGELGRVMPALLIRMQP